MNSMRQKIECTCLSPTDESNNIFRMFRWCSMLTWSTAIVELNCVSCPKLFESNQRIYFHQINKVNTYDSLWLRVSFWANCVIVRVLISPCILLQTSKTHLFHILTLSCIQSYTLCMHNFSIFNLNVYIIITRTLYFLVTGPVIHLWSRRKCWVCLV